MARILGLEELPHSLRSALSSSLRVSDECTTLPNAFRSVETGSFKNTVLKLSGTETDIDPDVFSSNWFTGISVLEVPAEVAEPIIKNAARRERALRSLSTKIQSELADSEVQVGAQLDADETDRDLEGWTCGFDTTSNCVGLYSARQSRAPESGLFGFERVHMRFFLICKAGGGLAAQTFHSRLTSALRKGKTLDECLESGTEPGPQALRRVTTASRRNRARILLLAAESIGFHTVDTLSDNAAAPDAPHRMAITMLDITTNSIRKDESATRSVWTYAAGCVDGVLSHGIVTCSNVAEGFVAFTSSEDDFKISLRNEASNCIPFSTKRLATTREIAMKAAEAHKKREAHPDHEFIQERFVWKSKNVGQPVDIEPACLWGSHATEHFLSNWSRELGLAQFKAVRLTPEAVCIAALEPAKLRAAARFIKS
jgi:hypothetical protein